MRFVIQTVSNSEVRTDGRSVGKIGRGYMILIGIEDTDTEQTADKMVSKMLNLRINPDEQGKTNLSLADINGSLLLISQFTLYADCHHGNRPNFLKAGAPDKAEKIYEYIIEKCRKTVPVVEKGVFGANMQVSLVNEGPFTIILDSADLKI